MSEEIKTKAKRGYTLSLRLKESEYDRLKALCGNLSLSDYTRQCLFGEQTAKRKCRAKKIPSEATQLLLQIRGQIGRYNWSSNINQIAKAVHCGNVVLPLEEQAVILEAGADIREIKGKIDTLLKLLRVYA